MVPGIQAPCAAAAPPRAPALAVLWAAPAAAAQRAPGGARGSRGADAALTPAAAALAALLAMPGSAGALVKETLAGSLGVAPEVVMLGVAACAALAAWRGHGPAPSGAAAASRARGRGPATLGARAGRGRTVVAQRRQQDGAGAAAAATDEAEQYLSVSLNLPPLPPSAAAEAFWRPIVALRREIHMYPEPGFQEVETLRRVREALVEYAGVEASDMRVLCRTGLVVDLRGTGPPSGGPVRCIALRADLDGLGIAEDNEKLPYHSKVPGMAHMCGHDGHIAALVGTAAVLSTQLHCVPSDCAVRLLFQPAEEGPGGAEPMIRAGCLEGVDEVYGWHSWTTWPLGSLAVREGPVMAHEAGFRITVTGRGAHGSAPDKSIDPVVCAATIVTSLQTIVSRSLPSAANAVVSVTTLHAGECSTAIPDVAKIGGTIRDLSPETFGKVKEVMQRMVAGIAAGFDCKANVEIASFYPETVNDAAAVEVVERCAQRGTLPLEVTSEGLPLMGAEDFSYYLQQRPGCFFFLGGAEESTSNLADYPGCGGAARSNCCPHGTSYDFNDNLLPYAASMFVKIVEDRFGVQLSNDWTDEIFQTGMALKMPAPISNYLKRAR